MNELTQKNQDIALFDSAKISVTQIVSELSNCLVTSTDSREKLFEMCKTSKQKIAAVDTKRKDFNRPLAADKLKLKTQYEADIKPLDKRKSNIEEYVKTLKNPLTEALADASTRIMRWDGIQTALKAKELAKIEKEKKEQREREDKVEADRLEKIRLENVRIEREKQDKLDAAKKITGMEARKAQVLADIAAKTERDRVEKESQEAAATARIDSAIERSDLNDKQEDLNKESRGQEKIYYEATGVSNINLVPEKYIIKKINWVLVKEDVKNGVSEIAGINIEEKKVLQFKKSRV